MGTARGRRLESRFQDSSDCAASRSNTIAAQSQRCELAVHCQYDKPAFFAGFFSSEISLFLRLTLWGPREIHRGLTRFVGWPSASESKEL